MWTLITNCSKQLTINNKVREQDGTGFKIYKITEVEFDQYKLTLMEKNNEPVSDDVTIILTCDKLMEYRFEVA